MKKSLSIIWKILFIFLGLAVVYLILTYVYYLNHEPEIDETKTNIKASIYSTDEEFLEYLKAAVDEVSYKAITKKQKDANDSSKYNFYVVPGMESTLTINSSTKEQETCSSMTPQGMAVMEKYIFISSYCHTHDHNSVIYVISKKTGKLVKEIILPSSSHVGGLAYDDKNDKLWITEYKSGKAYVSSLTLKKIEKYKLEKPIAYDDEVQIKDLKRTSFLTYYDKSLIVGNFDLLNKGKLNVHEIKNNSLVTNAKYTKKINSMVQGIAIHDDFIAMSTSYGLYASKVLVFLESDLENDLTESNSSAVYTFPEKLEQIYIYDNKVYMLFESAAFNYRFTSNDVIDRVITFDLD